MSEDRGEQVLSDNEGKIDTGYAVERVGNTTLTFFAVDHNIPPDQKYLPDNKTTLADLIPQIVSLADAVVFEYFPDELAKVIDGVPLYDRMKSDRLAFFTPFADEALKQEKKAIVLDPAFDEWFQIVSTSIQGGLPGIGAAIGSQYVPKLIDNLQKKVTGSEMSRRRFISMGVGVLGGAVGTVVGLKPLANFTSEVNEPAGRISEPDFRRLVVARGLTQIASQEALSGKNLLIMYPPEHVAGIRRYINEPHELESEYKRWTSLLVGPLERFKSIREYRPVGGKWNLESSTRIV